MSRSHYSLQVLWFAVPDAHGRSRTGVLCGIRWAGEWPISEAMAQALLPEEAIWEEIRTRFKHAGRMSQSILGRFALHELKSRLGALKPSMSFSMSHSGRTAVVLGFESQSCGIDLEIGDDHERSTRVVQKFATPMEVALVEDEGLSPWSLWCAKEALSKALGTGLQAPLSQYAVDQIDEGVISFTNFKGFCARAWDLDQSGSHTAHFALVVPEVESADGRASLKKLPILDWYRKLG